MATRSSVALALGVLALAGTVGARQQTVKPPATVPVTTVPQFPTTPPRGVGLGTREPLTAIVGQVIDSNGRPVPQAAVRLIADQVVQTVLTDPKGRFAFTQIPLGEMIVTAEKYGDFPGGFGQRRATGLPLPFSLPYGKTMGDMKIEVYRGSTVVGSVRDEAGEPIVGAKVFASRRQFIEGEWRYIAVDAEDSDDQGQFRIFELLPGEYIISVGSMPVAINQQGPTQLKDRDQPSMYPRMYYPQAPDRTLALPVQLTAGEVRYGVNFTMPPVTTRRVTGQLHGPDKAISGQTIKLVPIDASWSTDETATTTSEDDGSFVFEAVPEGRYRVHAGSAIPKVWTSSNPDKLAEEIDATRPYCGQTELTIVGGDVPPLNIDMVQAAVIAGIIDEVRTGNKTASPLRSVPISIEPNGPGLSRSARLTVPAGIPFAFSDLIPGSYFLRVGNLSAGWSVRSIEGVGDAFDHPIDVKDADVKTVITVTDRGTEIIGTVRDNRMQAASGAAVIVMPTDISIENWKPNRVRETRTSTMGTFTLHGLPAGDYLVVAIDEASIESWQDERVIKRLVSMASRLKLRENETTSVILQIMR